MSSTKPLTIMIADDDFDDRELLKFLFNQNEKFEILGCFNLGTEVIDEIITKKNIPDILLIDMYMPMISGTEVIMQLEESGLVKDTTKFIISTTINTTEEEKLINNPSVKFLKKPVTLVEINDLPGIILEHLNHRNNTKI
jgi:FixJ family two-component response regulator